VRIERAFTTDQKDSYEGIRFTERNSKITNADGSVVSEIGGVIVPDFWSQVARSTFAKPAFLPAARRSWKREFQSGCVRRRQMTKPWHCCPRQSVLWARPIRARCSAVWPDAGRIGAGKIIVLRMKVWHGSISMRCVTCWRVRWRLPILHSGSTPV